MLYVVATPIGNLNELSPRALKILTSVDIIAAEDTRHSRKLCQHFGIKTKLISYQQHNEQQQIPQLIDLLQQGKDIALISDAGMPLISDPGYRLIAHIRQLHSTTAVDNEHLKIEVISGPCALINALAGSGLPTDSFHFAGFLPSKTIARDNRLIELSKTTATIVVYEAPHRLCDSLSAMTNHFGASRLACVARELTKLHESWYHDELHQLTHFFTENSDQCRGEIVIIVAGASATDSYQNIERDKIINILADQLPPNKASVIAAKILGESKKDIYRQLIKS